MGISTTGASLQVSTDEALILSNALNEVLHGIEVAEFEARLGTAPHQAEQLLKELSAVLDK